MSEYEQMTNPQLDALEKAVRAWDMRGDYAPAILITITQAREAIQLRQNLMESEAKISELQKDKERLDWLEDREYTMFFKAQGIDSKSVWDGNTCLGDADTGREAIDTAMGKDKV